MFFLSATDFDFEIPKQIEGIELRLDLFSSWDLERIQHLLTRHPVLITLRSQTQGGHFEGTEKERESLILQLLSLKPPFFDLEWDMREEFLRKVVSDHPETKFIFSAHFFEESPSLETIYSQMKTLPAFHYKIAVLSQSTSHTLELLLFSRKHQDLSVIPMGEFGSFGRILGPVVGNFLNFTVLTKETAPGQLTAEELFSTYHWDRLTTKTALYGLIGDPVEGSQGHHYHNGAFAREESDAVYVKMRVKPEELSSFFPLAKEIGFQGLSVTMPLKEAVLPWVDHLDSAAQKIRAANTLQFQGKKVIGTNTDGAGALDALEKRGAVRGKNIAIVGAGGAAKAIAFEAVARGAKVWICNRTEERAKTLAAMLGCEGSGLTDAPPLYDILIHCSPDPKSIPLNPGALVMDIVYHPKETPLLRQALAMGCEVVYGEEMFFNQAARQRALWSQS